MLWFGCPWCSSSLTQAEAPQPQQVPIGTSQSLVAHQDERNSFVVLSQHCHEGFVTDLKKRLETYEFEFVLPRNDLLFF